MELGNRENTKILYISTLCSTKVLKYIFRKGKTKPGQAVQKFHRLIVEGLVANGNLHIDVLSSPPITPASHASKNFIFNKVFQRGINFYYIPVFNFRFVKNLIVFVYTFFFVVIWKIRHFGKETFIFCDILNNTICWSSFLAAKLLRIKTLVFVTDIPGFLITQNKPTFFKGLIQALSFYVLRNFDLYILLTRQMKDLVNPKNRPYLVMEGLVDSSIAKDDQRAKEEIRIVMYAGGIFEKYGVKKLIEGFRKLKVNDIELHIYGSGDLEPQMEELQKMDKRLKYLGVQPNEIIIQKLQEATLLVNPRPSNEEFTKYSFPSKNLEYMVSGTPLVTTKLPGIPQDHYNYVHFFKDETSDGIFQTLSFLLEKQPEEHFNFALKAKDFALTKKSNIVQAQRINEFITSKF